MSDYVMYEKEILKRFNEFLRKYGSSYTDNELNYIRTSFLENYLEPATSDILMQVYDEIGLNDVLRSAVNNNELGSKYDRNSFYLEHLNNLMSNFDINCNILDACSGYIPAFGNNIAKVQMSTGNGRISVYDPKLIISTPKYSNMKLYKEKITDNTSIKEYDLLTAIFPCEATKMLIAKACKERKNFYIAMCGCTHYTDEELLSFSIFKPLYPKNYQNDVIEMAKKLVKKYDNGKLIVDRLDKYYDIDYPILYNKK